MGPPTLSSVCMVPDKRVLQLLDLGADFPSMSPMLVSMIKPGSLSVSSATILTRSLMSSFKVSDIFVSDPDKQSIPIFTGLKGLSDHTRQNFSVLGTFLEHEGFGKTRARSVARRWQISPNSCLKEATSSICFSSLLQWIRRAASPFRILLSPLRRMHPRKLFGSDPQ